MKVVPEHTGNRIEVLLKISEAFSLATCLDLQRQYYKMPGWLEIRITVEVFFLLLGVQYISIAEHFPLRRLELWCKDGVR